MKGYMITYFLWDAKFPASYKEAGKIWNFMKTIASLYRQKRYRGPK